MKNIEQTLTTISKLYEPLPPPGGSVLLSELVTAITGSDSAMSITEAFGSPLSTPLLHSLSSIQAYIRVFIHMCRFGQVGDITKTLRDTQT